MSPGLKPVPTFKLGDRVSIATTSGHPEGGTFEGEAGPYFDGSLAAWVRLDDGPVAFLPLADLSAWRAPRRVCPIHRTQCSEDLCAEACPLWRAHA